MVLWAGILIPENRRIRPLANLTRTPAGVFALNVQNVVFYLEGEFIGIPIGTSAPVRQALNTPLLVAIEDLVTCLARNAELPAEFRRRLAG